VAPARSRERWRWVVAALLVSGAAGFVVSWLLKERTVTALQDVLLVTPAGEVVVRERGGERRVALLEAGGAARWSAPSFGRPLLYGGVVQTDDGTVAVAQVSPDGRLVVDGLRVADGQRAWLMEDQRPGLRPLAWSGAVLADRRLLFLVFMGDTHVVYQVDERGQLGWTQAFQGNDVARLVSVASHVAVLGNRELALIDAETGEVTLRREVEGVVSVFDDALLYPRYDAQALAYELVHLSLRDFSEHRLLHTPTLNPIRGVGRYHDRWIVRLQGADASVAAFDVAAREAQEPVWRWRPPGGQFALEDDVNHHHAPFANPWEGLLPRHVPVVNHHDGASRLDWLDLESGQSRPDPYCEGWQELTARRRGDDEWVIYGSEGLQLRAEDGTLRASLRWQPEHSFQFVHGRAVLHGAEVILVEDGELSRRGLIRAE